MFIVTDILDYLLSMFYNWNSLDFIILALALYGCYRWGYKKASQAMASQPHRQRSQAQAKSIIVDDGARYKLPPALRDKQA